MTTPTDTGFFDLGDLAVEAGGTIRGARIAWKTYGRLAPARDNVVVYPTSYSATHDDQEWLVTPDGILDPSRWFVVTPDMFGNGLSSSPSTTDDYPALVTVADNVRAQARVLREQFGVDRVAAVYGFSMGAQQAYHWASLHPDMVERAIVFCPGQPKQLMLVTAYYASPTVLGDFVPGMGMDSAGGTVHITKSTAAFINEDFPVTAAPPPGC